MGAEECLGRYIEPKLYQVTKKKKKKKATTARTEVHGCGPTTGDADLVEHLLYIPAPIIHPK